MNILEATWAYVAGLLDGEGSIVVDVAWSKTGSPYHMLRVSICSTSRVLIDWLVDTFGGSVSNDTRSSIKRGRRPCWAWRLSANRAKHFLEHVRPYVIEKKKQVALAIEFQHRKNGCRTSRPLPAEIVAEREWYRQEISHQNLNGRAFRSPASAGVRKAEEQDKTDTPFSITTGDRRGILKSVSTG
jgi:hypothetical protein